MHDEMIDALPELALDLASVVEAQGERCQVRNAYRSSGVIRASERAARSFNAPCAFSASDSVRFRGVSCFLCLGCVKFWARKSGRGYETPN